MTGYANPDVLVETQWVAEHLDDPSIRIIEANFDREAYETGHIPGALAWTWNDYQHPVRNDIQDKEGWEALLSRSGVAKDTTLVLYEQSRNWYSIFGFWLLTMYGHEDIRIMNGGRDKWISENRPMVTAEPTLTPTAYQAPEPDPAIRAMRDIVVESIGDPSRVLVDVRDPVEYEGGLYDAWKLPTEGRQRGGRIPGAVHIPWNMAREDDGTFKSFEALQDLYASRGVTPDKEAITYCVIGGRSVTIWFVLKCLLGYPHVRLYDGSWLEWGGLIGVPIER